MRKLTLALGLVLIMVVPCFGATTVTIQGNVVNITAIDTTDWYYTTAPSSGPTFTAALYPNGIYIHHIDFYPGATDDTCTFRLASASGVVVWKVKCADTYDQKTSPEFPANIPYKLYFDSDNPNDNAVVIIHLR